MRNQKWLFSTVLACLVPLILLACSESDNDTDAEEFEIRNVNLYDTAPATYADCMVDYDNYWDQLANCDHQIIRPDWEQPGTAYKVFSVDADRILVLQMYAVNLNQDTRLLITSVNGGPETRFELDFSRWGQLDHFEIGIDILADQWDAGVYEINYWLESEYGRQTPVYTLEIQIGP